MSGLVIPRLFVFQAENQAESSAKEEGTVESATTVESTAAAVEGTAC